MPEVESLLGCGFYGGEFVGVLDFDVCFSGGSPSVDGVDLLVDVVACVGEFGGEVFYEAGGGEEFGVWL